MDRDDDTTKSFMSSSVIQRRINELLKLSKLTRNQRILLIGQLSTLVMNLISSTLQIDGLTPEPLETTISSACDTMITVLAIL